MHFLTSEIFLLFLQTSNRAMARSIGPIVKPRPPLEREIYALSYESNLTNS